MLRPSKSQNISEILSNIILRSNIVGGHVIWWICLVPHFLVCCWMVYNCLVSGIYVILFSDKLLVFYIWKKYKGDKWSKDVLTIWKMWNGADKKNNNKKQTFKTTRYKQIQIYISTIHVIKYFKTLVFWYCLLSIPECVLCVCVSN